MLEMQLQQLQMSKGEVNGLQELITSDLAPAVSA
jgi:hypothetical protein